MVLLVLHVLHVLLVLLVLLDLPVLCLSTLRVKVSNEGDMRFVIASGQKYVSPGTISVEGDASSASYFLGGAAITGGPVTVRGCGRDSVQVLIDQYRKTASRGGLRHVLRLFCC